MAGPNCLGGSHLACNGFGGGEAGGATNIPSVISHGRPLPCYTRKSTSQLSVNNINSMDRLKLLSTTSSASKSGTDRTTKHTPEQYISSCFFYFITIILIITYLFYNYVMHVNACMNL